MDKNVQMLIGTTNGELEIGNDTSGIKLINYKHDTSESDKISKIDKVLDTISICSTVSNNKYVVFHDTRKQIRYGILLNKFNKVDDFFEIMLFGNKWQKTLKKVDSKEVIAMRPICDNNFLVETNHAYYMLQEK